MLCEALFFSESETKRVNVCMRSEEWVGVKVGVTCVDVESMELGKSDKLRSNIRLP